MGFFSAPSAPPPAPAPAAAPAEPQNAENELASSISDRRRRRAPRSIVGAGTLRPTGSNNTLLGA